MNDYTLDLVKCELDYIFFENFSNLRIPNSRLYIRRSPYEVNTKWDDDNHIVITAAGYYARIKAKDNIFDILFGTSWEGRVRKAQKKAFETAYLLVKNREMKNYQLTKLT